MGSIGPALDPPALNALGAGAVELREDVPLKRVVGAGGAGGAWCGTWGLTGGARLVPGAFGLLSACITVALLAQVYVGHYQVVPHGAVSSGAALCSRAATDALKEGGGALDAAVTASLCLAVVAPHRTSLDASGSLLYWEYREARTQQPVLYEWGTPGGAAGGRPPRLLAALAHLHAQLGALPWPRLLQPAVQLASGGFPVSEGLALAAGAAGRPLPPGNNTTAPELALYLASFMGNTSAELSGAWGGSKLVRATSPARVAAGPWRVVTGGPGGAAAARVLHAALDPPPASPLVAQSRVEAALQRETRGGVAAVGGGVATGLAAVDRRDNYVALVTGLSVPFGSGPAMEGGEGTWLRDEPVTPIDVAPAFIIDSHVCGSRYVVGAESWLALAQAGAALAVGGAPSAVESARLTALPGVAPSAPFNSSACCAAVNVVLQRGDALSSHADSRGGGLASRF